MRVWDSIFCCSYWWNTVCIPRAKVQNFLAFANARCLTISLFLRTFAVMNTTINIKQKSEICVGALADNLERLLPRGRVVVITDANIDRLYHPLVERFEHIIIGSGETNKTLQTVENIYRQLMAMGADRSTFLLGIGGGIVTDITGFVAATYMRGVEFGFVSTTLLGAVDASVGGKNGVNVAQYKNMVGTFLQPRFVITDVAMLRTLPEREWRAGLAEVVKAAVIGDSELFELLERSADSLRHTPELLHDVVVRAIRLKADIVERDERESGVRRVLNLGHTLGHAIEKSTQRYNHGEAVAIGLSMIAEISVRRGIMPSEDAQRIDALLERLGFVLRSDIALNELFREVRYDKKRQGDHIRIVFTEAIGRCRIESVSLDEFGAMLQK